MLERVATGTISTRWCQAKNAASVAYPRLLAALETADTTRELIGPLMMMDCALTSAPPPQTVLQQRHCLFERSPFLLRTHVDGCDRQTSDMYERACASIAFIISKARREHNRVAGKQITQQSHPLEVQHVEME